MVIKEEELVSPWLAPDPVTQEEQRQQVEGCGYPSTFGTFGDTSMTTGENLQLVGHVPPWLGWARGASGPACEAVGEGLGTSLGMHMSKY